ncbi:putative apyrase 6 [Cocos nucifera]|uniref:Putative apyrase 6 n=1 Tax=Cocos nucifera TaxID=13894 RepID=A0A8K0ISI3_COCNU|nr:putative apyrase 6 [Cocos nucifera]
MDASKPQLRPPPARPSLASRISSPGPKNRRTGIRLFLAMAAAAALLLCLLHVSRSSGSSKFGIIMDGGSTGTRIHVFGYTNRQGALPLLDFGVMASMKVSPGLSDYSGDPEGAGRSLVELLEFGKGRVPRDQWGETEIRLMATAGLRLLDVGVAERILDSCRKVLRSSGFQFQDDWATVISGRLALGKTKCFIIGFKIQLKLYDPVLPCCLGIKAAIYYYRSTVHGNIVTGSDEGIYAWVAANYALGSLGGDPGKTTGIVELGGASAQVTFVSNEPLSPEFLHVLNIGETTYNLYSHSFLHLGQNVAYESLHELLSSRVLKSSAESGQEPIYRDPCTPRGYSHSVESLKLSTGVFNSRTEYRPVADATGNFSECRSASLELLQKEKGFANQVGDIPLDWALGAFIMQKMPKESPEHSGWIAAIVGNDSSILSLFLVPSVLIMTAWTVAKWRKPQLRTIYDLEKGRYFMRQVNR